MLVQVLLIQQVEHVSCRISLLLTLQAELQQLQQQRLQLRRLAGCLSRYRLC